MYTRKQYMNKEINHHEYYAQFVTDATKEYVLRGLSIKDIKKALDDGDKHLNKIKIPFNRMGSGGNWWWDFAPANRQLMRQAGESSTPTTRTCVAKACAKELATK